ncbi:MAG: hypothetical protein IPK52_01960 [Chloroflexi bacterium]|nr:hypothetical protein [Chloroflexota bacterium]
MNQHMKSAGKFTFCVVLTLIVAGQVLAAQGSRTEARDNVLNVPSFIHNCANNAITAGPPKWVLDRQQYDTAYVFGGLQGDSGQAVAMQSSAPAWAADRKQYETAYVYGATDGDGQAVAASEPAWAADRQQYETAYVYGATDGDSGQAVAMQSSAPAWVADRRQYETAYVYRGLQGDGVTTHSVCGSVSEAAG